MDFGLGFSQHPSPILEFQGSLLPMSEEFSEGEADQKRTLSMGVVTGIVCPSETMTQTVLPPSLAVVSALTEGWGSGRPLPSRTSPHFPDQGDLRGAVP